MEKNEILEVLLDWNFWKKELYLGEKREGYLEKAKKFLDSNMVIAIIGVRRAGKSILMRQIAKSLIDSGEKKENILIVNFEDKRFISPDLKLLDEIYSTYVQELNPERVFIFLDEIHKVKNWEKWVRTFHELEKGKVIISGSSSNLLKGELASLLTGRHLDINVFPLSFSEFLKFKKVEIKDKLDLINKKNQIIFLLKEYLEFGGFPEVVKSSEKKEILINYFDDIITKDIVERHKIRKIEKLKLLAKFYLTNISSLITFSSVEKFLKIGKETVENFSSYLEESFLIFFNYMFHPSLKNQEKAPRKVYCIDNGIANAIGFKVSENFSKLMENVVAIELKKKSLDNPNIEIFYWKEYGKSEGKEVDFVVKNGFNIDQLIQVTYASNRDEIKEREIDALIKASELLNCKNLSIITWDYEDELKVNNKKIECIPLWKWLLNTNH
jgi:predicted AAA+ superfamily ATPase